MAGTIDAGELKLTLKLMRENFAQGMKAVDADLKKLGVTSETAGKKGASALGGLEKSLAGIGSQLMILAGSYFSVQQLVSAFVDFGKQETAINRVEASMRRMGLSTKGMRAELDSLGTSFIRAGQQEAAAWTGYQRLIQATGSAATAQGLLQDALRFATAQGEDAGVMAANLARAYSGQEMQLRRVLLAHGFAAESAKDFASMLELVKQGGEGAETAISKETQALYDLNAAWDTLKDTLGKTASSPVTNFLAGISHDIEQLSEKSWRLLVPWVRIYDFWRRMTGYRDAMEPGGGLMPEVVVSGGKGKVKPPSPFKAEGAGGAGGGYTGVERDYLSMFRKPAAEPYDASLEGAYDRGKARLKELDRTWLESTKLWREAIDRTANSLGYLMVDLPMQGKDAWRSFLDSLMSMLREMAAEFMSTTLKAQGLALLRQWFPTGGGGTSGGGGNDSTIQGFGGPRPIGPGLGGGVQPVYVTVKGDLTKYAEFKIVSAGLKQGRQAGF